MELLAERLYDLCEPVVRALDLAMVDVIWMPFRKTLVVYVARADEGRVGVSDCAQVAESLGPVLDAQSELTGYTLEVSSPGLDRVLKRGQEYDIFKGRRAKVVLHQTMLERREHSGVLSGRLGSDVLLASDSGDMLSIPIENIKKCQLEFRIK